jgi:hypothetical protein
VNEEYVDGFVQGYLDAVQAACEFYPEYEQDIEEHYNPFGKRFSFDGPDLKATSDYVRGYQAAFNLAYHTTLKNLNESLGGNMPPVLPAG